MELAKLLGVNPQNEFEAMAFIFKVREISVSDIIEVSNTCDKCKRQDIHGVNIISMFFQGEKDIDKSVPIGLFSSIEDLEDLEDLELSQYNINNLSINEYNQMESVLFDNNIKIFNPAVTLICRKCGNEYETALKAVDIVSKSTISNIYEQYLDISYHSHMTKLDTDSMLPFEREIFVGLIQKKEDEKSVN